ncbi:MAG: cohesin domain-containing protein [Saprospiraceae bacterium]
MKKCLFALVFSFGVLFQLSSQAPTVVIKQFICNSDDTYNLVIEVYGAGDISTFGGYQVDAGSYEVSSCYDSSLDTGLPCIITYPIPAPPPVCGCNGEEFSNEGCAINAGYPSWTEGPCTGSERVEFTIHNLPSTENTTINVFRLVKVDGEEFVGPSISIQANHTCSQASCLTCHPKTNPIVFTITQDTAVTIEHLMKETKQGCNLSFDRTQKIKEIPFVCSMLRIQPTLDSFWVYDLVKGDSCLSFVHFVNDGYCCTPYTTCDDKNPCTYGDYFDNNCNCIGKLNTSNKEYSFTTTNGEKIVMDKFADSCSVYVFIFYFHWCKPCQDLYKSHLPSDYDIHPNLKVIPIMMEATEANIDSLKNYGYNFIDNNPFKNIVDGGETEYLADHCLNTVPTVFVKCPSNDTLSVITPYGNKQSIPDAINNIIHNNCKCAPSNEVTISIPSKSVNYLDTFSIPVTVSGFKDILSFQFPVTYDTTKLEYLKIHSFSKKLNNFTNSSVGIPNKGKITCVYFEPNLTAFSLSNPDTLFSIQFKTLSNNCDSSMVSVPNSVQINNKPFEIEISDNFKPLLYKTTDSQIKLNQTLCNNCTHPDYAPLMALYNSTNGKDWTNNTGWKEGAEGSSCDPCNFYGKAWYGVQCENGRLTHVDLSNNKLKGELPKEFCELIYLHSLSLRSNELIGKIPNDVNRLEKLRFLDIGNNQLSGELPNEIGELENLAVIQLDENTLTGSIPKGIGRLTKLINLTISENRLSGEIPNEIGELGNLSIIQLNKNTLTGSIPKEIGRLTKLETLSLADNELSGEIPKEIDDWLI